MEEARAADDDTSGIIQSNDSPAQRHVLRPARSVRLGHGEKLLAAGAQLLERLLGEDQTCSFAGDR